MLFHLKRTTNIMRKWNSHSNPTIKHWHCQKRREEKKKKPNKILQIDKVFFFLGDSTLVNFECISNKNHSDRIRYNWYFWYENLKLLQFHCLLFFAIHFFVIGFFFLLPLCTFSNNFSSFCYFMKICDLLVIFCTDADKASTIVLFKDTFFHFDNEMFAKNLSIYVL